MLQVLKSEVFISGGGGGMGDSPPLSEFSGSAPDGCETGAKVRLV